MRILGIILIIVGILMLIFTNISFTQEKKVVDLGPLQVNKKEKKTIDWPNYAGAVAVIGGIALVALDRKRV